MVLNWAPANIRYPSGGMVANFSDTMAIHDKIVNGQRAKKELQWIR